MTTINEPKYDHNGKAIRAYEVIEVQANGHEISHGSFSPAAKFPAYNLAENMNEFFGFGGVEFFVRVHRFA